HPDRMRHPVARCGRKHDDPVFNEGPLTGLVNNAAGNFISRTKDLSPNGSNAIANIVFHGTFYVTLTAGKRWIDERQQANGTAAPSQYRPRCRRPASTS